MNPLALHTPADWVDAVAALPAPGALPARTVLVPSERHAHALRRALARSGREAVLAGARFVGPLTAAEEVLRAAGVVFAGGEEALRPARLLALFRRGVALEHFDLALLLQTRGWEEAFAGAIQALEEAGLAPADLPADTAQARDVARVWAEVVAEAGTSWTGARIHGEAAALLERDARAWPFPGAVLAVVTGHESAAQARFVRAIPGLTLGVWRRRPLAERHLWRVEALYGKAARAVLERAAPFDSAALRSGRTGEGGTSTPTAHLHLPLVLSAAAERRSRRTDAPPTELDLLRAHLFAPPDALASERRPRSTGPDGSVHLEEHAGVDAELEATAAWVSRQVLERALPLEEIAVLVPAQDPLAQLVAERLARLPYESGPLPVHVAGGVRATSSVAGARILAVLRALDAHLAADALAQVLPALRIEAPPAAPQHLTHGEAMELAYALGTVGGSAACPAEALTWSPRAAARIAELEAALLRAERGEDSWRRPVEVSPGGLPAAMSEIRRLSAPQPGGRSSPPETSHREHHFDWAALSDAREARRLARALANLRAVRPALDALVGVARALVDGASLAALCDVLFPFLDAHLLAPGEGAQVAPRLAEALAPARAGAPGAALAGGDALALVTRHLLALRLARGRFGDPAVYVGTVAGSAGLAFAAVRVVGLCEGVLPAAPREDPVVPEALRAAIEAGGPGRVVRSAADRAAAQVHALAAAVDGARDALVLSAPRVDLARTEREPAALFVDAAAALGRPDAATGARTAAVPGAQALRRDAFLPARAAAAAFRAAGPVSEADWLDRAARVEAASPPWWAGSEVVALGRIAALRASAGAAGAAEGVLGAGDPFPPVPGVDAARPISASALGALLSCPRMFLMQRVLGWDVPASAPALRELDALSFGTLVHRVHETLYRAHGAEIDARARTLAHWQGVAAEVADRAFAEMLAEVPLLGAEVRRKERARLGEAVRTFLEHDWSGATARRFIGVEVPFGYDAPLTVDAGGAALHVGGYIDRVDVEGGATLVRDLKTGRVHPREGDETGPTAGRDVQLGLYQLAARRLAGRWGTPERVVAAYVYANGRGDVEERAFRVDAAALATATEGWLATASALLHGRAFVSTPHAEDCTLCPFAPVCGAEAPRRAAACLAEAEGGPLARFRALKDGEEEGG